MSDGGKGSNPRPFSVDRKTFDQNWNKIFKTSKIDKKVKDMQQCSHNEKFIIDHAKSNN